MTEDERLLREEVKLGGDAKELLNNELFNNIFEGIREGLIGEIENCALQDDVLRNQLMISLQLLKQIKDTMQESITSGVMAQMQLAQTDRLS